MQSIVAVTIFPEMFAPLSRYSVIGRALSKELVTLSLVNPRDFSEDNRGNVDDRPYGGGPGMVMLYSPLKAAITHARSLLVAPRVVGLSPQGRRLNHHIVRELSRGPDLILVCGRYEGVDERLIEAEFDEELSLGDFVLSGGELAAAALIDAVVRLTPGALGHELSAAKDSFFDGLLDCPHYTRPSEIEGRGVPEVLLSGDHDAIRQWRLKQSLGRTWLRRPDLLAVKPLDTEKTRLLEEFIIEYERKRP